MHINIYITQNILSVLFHHNQRNMNPNKFLPIKLKKMEPLKITFLNSI